MVLNRRRDKLRRLERRAVKPVQPESPSKVLLSVNPSLHVMQQPPPLASLHLPHSPPLLLHLHRTETDPGAAWPVEPAERDSRSCQHLPVPLTLGCRSRWSWDFLSSSRAWFHPEVCKQVVKLHIVFLTSAWPPYRVPSLVDYRHPELKHLFRCQV